MWLTPPPDPRRIPPDAPRVFYAPWWEWFGAWLFGQRFESLEGVWHTRCYWWRGKLYFSVLESIYGP